jgi:glutaredoxin-dependent peroxiredoxin
VWGISTDTPFSQDKFKESLSLPFPLLSDMERKVVKDFHIEHEINVPGIHSVVAKRTYFLVGTDGKILWENVEGKLLPDQQVVDAVTKFP